ncbi:MAG: MFS transporter [Patescibacteria group bacterium]
MASNKKLWLVYLGGFLMAVHFALISYVNSSLLGQFVGNNTLSVLYIFGSLLAVISLLLAPFLLRKYGSVLTFLFFIALEILAAFGMGSINDTNLVISLFLIQIGAASMLYFCLDVNLEQEIKIEGTTGGRRGVLLAISNIAWVLSPLALVFLINQNSFSKVYFLSGLALIPLFLIVILFFKNTQRADVADSNILLAIVSLTKQKDQARIITIQFILNFFYAWMVIYLPLLLSREIGFGWDKIGWVFMIMLLPFLLFELPAGILSDKKMGEKELLIAGFIIMFLATFIIPMLATPVFWIWALVLFITRIGAALIEVSSESYFFKHVKEEDTGLISLFRMTRPLSYVIVPLFVLPIIYFFSYSTSFYFLAFFTLSGLLFIPKKDTR